ncbi:MAG TPA: ABC transporter permease/substrate-binding protein [Opitutaceae bacterium]|nr:ABC transporter permease/substrate-binding protein [Opitutaceae bacterium]
MNLEAIRTFLLAHRADLATRISEHLNLVALALLAAAAIGLPLAVALRYRRGAATVFLGFAGVVQTVPSLALLSVMLPLFGLGRETAVVALFLYALLPVMRNTLVGLDGVDAGVVDTARGMGMNGFQLFWTVELPLALPTIFAGLRTAAVISVGIATLSALVGAGGLGVFIFRGIATSQPAIIFLGAVPAALLALGLDGALGLAQHFMLRYPRRVTAIGGLVLVGCVLSVWRPGTEAPLLFGFTSGFVQRTDGYEAWRKDYGLPALRYNELNPSLLYDALHRGEIDVACGYSTDGKISAFGFRSLVDDRNFFPHYDAALLSRSQLFERIPGLRPLLDKLTGALSEQTMRQLNLRVDQDGVTPDVAATEFLRSWAPGAGIEWEADRARAKRFDLDAPDLVIGAMNTTEQYILGNILEQLIDGATAWNAELKSGLGGTAICFEALQRGNIDLCPEYAGSLTMTVFSNSLDSDLLGHLSDTGQLNGWLTAELAHRYSLVWMAPLGYNRSYTLLVRQDDSRFARITTISELKPLIESQ